MHMSAVGQNGAIIGQLLGSGSWDTFSIFASC